MSNSLKEGTLKNVNDLVMLKMLLRKNVLPVKVSLWGRSFLASTPRFDYVQVECVETGDVKAVNDKQQLVNFFVNNTVYHLGPTNNIVLDQFVREVMMVMMGPGVGDSYESLETTIGSRIESRPEETEYYLNLLKTARSELVTV